MKILNVDGYKNIFPVMGVMLFICVVFMVITMDIAFPLGIMFLSIIGTFAGTIASILLSTKLYLAIISQLLILPTVILVIFAVLERKSDLFLALIISNALSVIVAVCIRLIYELCSKLLRRERGAEPKGNGHE